MKFRTDIEGLRAVAITPVVIFHAWPSALPGGFVGVDIFFVISGYLITTLLLQRLENGRYSIASFYAARIRRIFPALFAMLLLLVPAAVLLLDPTALCEFARVLGATGLFLSNLELHRTTGYFEGAAELKPLVHTWSLAVEEQYYIVFPLLLATLYRWWRRGVGMVLLSVGVASLLYCIWLLRRDASLAFYSAPSRTFELMIGSGLAWWVSREGTVNLLSKAGREILACLGLVGIVVSVTQLSADKPFPGLTALLPALATAALIGTGGSGQRADQPTLVAGLLAWTPLRWVGALSFSLYLWHWPVLVFSRHLLLGHPTEVQAGAAVVVALALAWASLHWVETPARRAAWPERRILLGGCVAIFLCLLVAVAITMLSGSLQRQPDRANSLLAGAKDFSAARLRCHLRGSNWKSYAERCELGMASAGKQLAVFGDSHGVELAMALGETAVSHRVAQLTASSCPPALDFDVPGRAGCLAHNRATVEALMLDDRVDVVVLAARFEHYLRDGQADAFEAGLLRTSLALRSVGKMVLLLEPIPTYPYPVPAALAQLALRHANLQDFGQSATQYRALQQKGLALVERVANQSGAIPISASAVLCPANRCEVLDAQDQPLYFDDNHLSMPAARALAPAVWIATQVMR